ncbi:hypothetical protein FEM48_Zijuj03G0002000 [Ziziphus jujuba var. spinosa]|uniref:23 kDa jasmonate-induced protein-like n=1 Tax=Ziziphus jujuba var. spinosa TaxID=714518 RepID=A0A978VM25_ZIZJJ|nr:hypothetical protein FEM48_Zijuj03G0002000 [Ziziphus jujuba var. spinosa]
MAASVPVNVFGEPITDATVRKYFPDKKEITRKDRAYFAYNLQEADKKHDEAQEYVLQQFKEWYGQEAATLITIYNATGDTLTYYTHHDFHGHIETPHKYTQEIQNGQWAAFLHVGSYAAVVYSGRNSKGQEIGWLHSWYNKASDNRKFVTPNVFGETMTDATVRNYFPDKQVITRKDRAYLTYNLKEAGNKNEKAEAGNKWYGRYGSAVTLARHNL